MDIQCIQIAVNNLVIFKISIIVLLSFWTVALQTYPDQNTKRFSFVLFPRYIYK